MPTYTIEGPGGQRFTIEAATPADALGKAQSMPTAPDKYQQAAIDQETSDKAAGIHVSAGIPDRFLHGATLGASDEILAAMATPIEMYRKGTLDPREGYGYAKAQQDLRLEEAKKRQGLGGTAAELAGGLMTGAGLAHAGLTTARFLGPASGLTARVGASAADAAGFGGVAGAMEGNSLGERATNAGVGAAVGGAVGTALPIAATAASGTLGPIISNIRARANPEGYAQSQLARALMESTTNPQAVARNVAQAATEGQGAYTVADALGNPGQRMLSGVTRSPGPGRTEAVEFLDQRQAGQARRLAQALSEGFNAPRTAEQTRDALTAARSAADDTAFTAVRAGNNSQPVDLSRTIAAIDSTLAPGATQIARPRSGVADDSIESALSNVRSRLTDGRSVDVNFQSVMRTRDDLADRIQEAVNRGQNNKARMLRGVRAELDTALENASPGYRAAMAQSATNARTIDAVGEGTAANARGRIEDTIPAFQGMTPAQQAAFRVGYVDPEIERVQGAAFGVNKARPMTSEAFQQESAAFAPGTNLMNRRIGRENTMFETRNQATGGSRTVDNFADTQAQGVDSMITSLLMGNVHGAARSALTGIGNVLSGSTPEVRHHLAQLLLARGNANHVADTLDNIIAQNAHIRQLAIGLSRGGMAAGAELPSAYSR